MFDIFVIVNNAEACFAIDRPVTVGQIQNTNTRTVRGYGQRPASRRTKKTMK